jgi:hypothetical protein
MKREDKLRLLAEASEAHEGTRLGAIADLKKVALGDQHGAFQHFQSNVADYATRERYLSLRGGDAISRDRDSLYGVGPEHEDSNVPTEYVAPHLSTRYSPDRVGIQAMRVSDGVFQDPYTNKVYDYNEGFNTEDGRNFPAGHASLQTNIMHLANHLDKNGLIKEATYLDVLLRKNATATGFVNTRVPWDDFTTGELMALMQIKMDELGLPKGSAPNREIHEWIRNINKTNPTNDPIVAKFLGKQKAGEAMHFEPGPNPDDATADPGNPPAKGFLDWPHPVGSARENRPLTTAEISKLLLENNDAGSPYKLDPARLAEMTNGNLTPEEAAIVDGITSLASNQPEVMSNLINLATHLDNTGMTKEANYLDAVIKRAAGLQEATAPEGYRLAADYAILLEDLSQIMVSIKSVYNTMPQNAQFPIGEQGGVESTEFHKNLSKGVERIVAAHGHLERETQPA